MRHSRPTSHPVTYPSTVGRSICWLDRPGGASPWAPAQCQEFLRRAEAAAGGEQLDGGLWHAYRRKWATERKELPLKDVAAAGGWKDVNTLLTCYQQADEATMLKVMESPVKLVSRPVAR